MLKTLQLVRPVDISPGSARDNKQPAVSSPRVIPGNQLSFRPRHDVDEDGSLLSQ